MLIKIINYCKCSFSAFFSLVMPKKYNQKDLLEAANAVRQGLSYQKASVKYGVPVMTIQNRVSGQIEDGAQPGRPTVIPEDIENKIVEKIKEAAAQGFGITRRMLAVRVGRMVRRMGIKTPFRHGVPGKDWINGFLRRHKDVSLRKPLALSTVRARMLNETVTTRYFEALGDILSNLNISDKPQLIWNIDETSVPLCHKPSRILGETGSKNIPGRVGNSRDNVSVLACVNAAGGEIPPMVIVKGKTYKSLNAYNTKEGVSGSVYTYQERAWMEDVLGTTWFTDHFLKHCGSLRPQLIILDSHSSHETLGLIDAAIQNDIALLAFPPHTTQWLCPLDKTVFGPLSRNYSRICTEFMASSPNNLVTKWEWPKLFKLAHDRAFSPSNISNGFKKCGIFPLNRYAIPATAFAPSKPFDKNTSSMTCSGDATSYTNPPVDVPTSCIKPSTSLNPIPTSSSTEPIPEPTIDGSVPGTVELVSEQQLIDSVLSGEVPCSVDDDGNIQFNIEVANDIAWSSQINTEFALPMSNVVQKPPSSKKLTAHRLLTSDAIFNIKKQENDKKEHIKMEKEVKKQARLIKKKEKDEKLKLIK